MEKKNDFLNLAKLLIELDDKNQLISYEQKLDEYINNPSTVFNNGEYYYDTQNQKNQVYRGKSNEIKENIEWFLLIDNLQFGHYLWEFDWKVDYSELVGMIGFLAKNKNYRPPEFPTEKEMDGKDAEKMFVEFNNVFTKHDTVLINLYIDSDSYVTGMIKYSNLENIILAAKRTGNKITRY